MKKKLEVIGWTSPYSYHFEVAASDDDEVYEAVTKDIKENGYLFSGEDHQDSVRPTMPVLSDYKAYSFSRRGFAAMMSDARDETDDFAYANYVDRGNHRLDNDAEEYPLSSIYPRFAKKNIQPLRVENALFNKVSALLQEAKELNAYILPINYDVKDGYYWPFDLVDITNDKGNVITAMINFIFVASNVKEATKAIEDAEKADDYGIKFNYDKDLISNSLKNYGKVLLLGLMSDKEVDKQTLDEVDKFLNGQIEQINNTLKENKEN